MNVSDFFEPVGELSEKLFPGADLEGFVKIWLAEATTKSATVLDDLRDRALRAWVYYRGYSTIATRLAGEPASASAEGVSRAISSSQIGYFDSKAQEYLNEFNTTLQISLSASQQGQQPWQSRGIRTKVIF